MWDWRIKIQLDSCYSAVCIQPMCKLCSLYNADCTKSSTRRFCLTFVHSTTLTNTLSQFHWRDTLIYVGYHPWKYHNVCSCQWKDILHACFWYVIEVNAISPHTRPAPYTPQQTKPCCIHTIFMLWVCPWSGWGVCILVVPIITSIALLYLLSTPSTSTTFPYLTHLYRSMQSRAFLHVGCLGYIYPCKNRAHTCPWLRTSWIGTTFAEHNHPYQQPPQPPLTLIIIHLIATRRENLSKSFNTGKDTCVLLFWYVFRNAHLSHNTT